MVNDKMVNIFDSVARRTPFRTPDGYFESSKKQLIARTVKRVHHLRLLYGIAASFALLVGVYGFTRILLKPEMPADSIVYGQQTTPQEDWTDFAEADLFLENMNW